MARAPELNAMRGLTKLLRRPGIKPRPRSTHFTAIRYASLHLPNPSHETVPYDFHYTINASSNFSGRWVLNPTFSPVPFRAFFRDEVFPEIKLLPKTQLVLASLKLDRSFQRTAAAHYELEFGPALHPTLYFSGFCQCVKRWRVANSKRTKPKPKGQNQNQKAKSPERSEPMRVGHSGITWIHRHTIRLHNPIRLPIGPEASQSSLANKPIIAVSSLDVNRCIYCLGIFLSSTSTLTGTLIP